LELQGKAKNDVIILIDETRAVVEIYEAPYDPVDSHVLAEELTELFSEHESDKKNISVVSAGTAADIR